MAVEQMLRSLSRVEMRKVLHVLRFTWDVDNMRTWIKDEWTLLYDRHYVHDRLLQPAEDNWGEMQEILDRMDKSVVGKLPPRKPAPVTQAKPFNLTQPKPRTILVPKPVPNKPKHTPIPKSMYSIPLEKEALERKRRANRAKAERDLLTANTKSSRIVGLSTRTESSRFSSLKSTLAMREEESLRKTTRAQPIPATLKKDVTVKLNAGAILREEKHFRTVFVFLLFSFSPYTQCGRDEAPHQHPLPPSFPLSLFLFLGCSLSYPMYADVRNSDASQ